ncbi:hypothetical protein BDW71DRAFT_211160 [Aspergillus fruticulosus]
MNDDDDDGQASGILSSFVMLDMVSLTELHLRGVPDVQVPSVQTVEEVSLVSSSGGNADLSALVGAGSIRVEGPWASVNMQSLKDVTSKLIVCSETGCEVDYSQELEDTPVVAANFSALETATYVGVNGSFANISMSNLHSVGLSDSPASSGFEFHYRGSPAADFTLSPLHTLYGRLTIMGDVDGLSISPITNTSASIYINTTTRSEIFSTLHEATSLDIHGKIADIYFPFLTAVENLNITSEYEDTLSCPPSLQDLYNSTAASPSDIPSWCLEDSDEDNNDDDDANEGFKTTVSSASSSTKWSFPTGAIVGIVIGIIVMVLMVTCCTCAMRKGGERSRSTGDGGRSQNVNDNAHGNWNGNGCGGTVPIDDEHGGVPPPPYSKDPPVL